MHNVKTSMEMLAAPAFLTTLVLRQDVDPNVLSIQNVMRLWLALTTNVSTHVQERVVTMHSVMSTITYQFVHACLVLLEIRLAAANSCSKVRLEVIIVTAFSYIYRRQEQ